MNRTSIEWTHRPETGGASGGFTWNPIHAHSDRLNHLGTLKTGNFCTKISPGCANCYASRINVARGNGLEYTVPNLEKAKFYLDEKELSAPLRHKEPATIFVGDMFDLFHEAIPSKFIAEVFWVMGAAKQHVFQVLTKRADRMQQLLTQEFAFNKSPLPQWAPSKWPFPNIWLGTSVESQKYADERIPLLLQTPAAVRFLSVEPMLEAVDLIGKDWQDSALHQYEQDPKIDWVICGGESGPGARPFNLAWAESLMEQCQDAGVAFFMKQIGSVPTLDEKIWSDRYSPMRGLAADKKYWLKASHDKRAPKGEVPLLVKNSKGGDPSEWPAHLRIRQFPSPAEKLVTV
jgi:protein gp37